VTSSSPIDALGSDAIMITSAMREGNAEMASASTLYWMAKLFKMGIIVRRLPAPAVADALAPSAGYLRRVKMPTWLTLVYLTATRWRVH
jgi:hypothetical protein